MIVILMHFQCQTERVSYCTLYFSVEFQDIDNVSKMSLQSLV